MKRLVTLFNEIDTTTSTKAKVTALANYFRDAPPRDAIWTLYYFTGRKQKRLIKRRTIQEAVQEISGLSDWLFEESYTAVGDLAETVALLTETITQGKSPSDLPLHLWIEERLPTLAKAEDSVQKEILKTWWRELNTEEVFLLNKLMTGSFRSGASARLVVRGLVEAFHWDEAILSEKLIGDWPVTEDWFLSLGRAERQGLSLYPYPFFLASPTDLEPEGLGSPEEFAIEWKWDGIRSQIVSREGQIAIWSRGEELITQSFPELSLMAKELDDGTVLDGEILAFVGDQVKPFAELQKRLQRKKVSDKMVRENPVVFLAFDCLQYRGQDLRDKPLSERRKALQQLVSEKNLNSLRASPLIEMTLDAVMLYAQAGHGRRANLYTDYTFGLWKDGVLVPFAKAYSGLSNEEIGKLDAWIRKNTLEKFGPVRSVKQAKVFEIAFEGIQKSPRHKAGIAVRFPRILRERVDKKIEDADSLQSAMELLNG
ncbi:MAG: ATP-dependent DNA ligase [Proteobacteria bacterium]|nr:MAG: ATP-dependent DNA ligase [Pseudomonadota bacterium]